MKKRKQLLSLLLALCMVITMLPVPAFAGGAQTVTTYAEFKQAMEAAKTSGGIITLSGDITAEPTDEPYTFTGNSGVTITIDGNGHTITGPTGYDGYTWALWLQGEGTILLKDITLQGGTALYYLSNSYGLAVQGAINVREDITSSTGVTVKGGDADRESYGLYYLAGSGTVNITNAIGAKGNIGSYGLFYEGPGTVNVVNATGGDNVARSYGVQTSNYDATTKMGTLNVVNATGGKATLVSFGVNGVGTGTVNVTNAIGGNAPTSYSIYSDGGIINVANAQGATSTTNGAIINDNDKVTTLKLYKGAGASCVLDKVTIKTGPVSMGTLPEVVKGTEIGQWYTDIEKTSSVSDGVYGSSLYSTFFNPFTVTTAEAQTIGTSSADLSGAVIIEEDQIMKAKGFEWKKTTEGVYAQISDTSAGTGIAANLTGLTANTSYTVRAFVKDSSKTYYGEEKTFTTLPKPVPNAPINVTATAGNEQATISFEPPTDNGGSLITGYVVTSNPDNKTAVGNVSPIIVTGLTAGKTYTFTVKAVSEIGSSLESAASNPVTVPIPIPISIPPSVTTTEVNSIGKTSAVLNGTITKGSEAIIKQGFEWKQAIGGTYQEIMDYSTGTAITANLTGLTANTSYTVRAFVKDSSNTYYAEEKTFTTLKPVPDAPINVTAVAPTSTANDNGKLLGVTQEMEYRLNTSSMYIPVTATEVTGLAPGSYQVRYKEKPGYNAGADAEVTVPAYTAPSSGGAVPEDSSSTSETPAVAITPISLEAEITETIENLSPADKQEIAKNLREYLPYTLLSGEGLTIQQLQKLTNNKFTKEQLETIAKKPELLKGFGVDVASLIEVITLKPIANPSFSDVDASHWANEAIKKAAVLGLVSGMPDGSFEPDASLKAADAFTFLDRVLLLNHRTTSTLPRSTVEQYITDKNNWAFNSMASIGSKLTQETLRAVSELGDQPISRQLLAQVLYEITQGKLEAVKAVPVFTDIQSSTYQAAINYCVSVGLLYGTTQTTMSPTKDLTRAELMAILIRLDTLLK